MIKFMVDRAADIEKETAEHYGIEVLPFMVNMDGEGIVADKDMDIKEFYDKVKACDEIPSTSQRNIKLYMFLYLPEEAE